MSGLKLRLGQGVGLLSTSLLGTASSLSRRWRRWSLAITACGHGCSFSLFSRLPSSSALLGRHFPSAGGVAHFVDMAFGHVWSE